MTDQDLNEAVARRLGWKKISEGLQWERPHESGYPEVILECELPDYCRSIEAAWEIVKKTGDCNLFREGRKWSFWITNDYGEQEKLVTADTAPMAIVEAFLKLP